MDHLAAESQLWGVENGYFDVFGQWRAASPETQRRLTEALADDYARPPEVAPVPEPLRAFQGDGRRYWVLAVQLYALRSRRNWGHGDFGDLARLIELAAARGAAGIGLNPLHALFMDRAHEASPYSPNSRLFFNPLYIDIEAIPEFPGVDVLGFDLDILRGGAFVDHAQVARVKLGGLRAAYERFAVWGEAWRRAEFEAYRREQGERLLRFSCFEALRIKYSPAPWPDWPEPWRNPSRADLEELRAAAPEACEFHEFVQWIADRQLRACQGIAHRFGTPVGLYVDLAVGIHPHGADAWSGQDTVLADFSVGAPPDELNHAGQNWCLAPFNPHALAAKDFAPLREVMRSALRHAGAIRIDHVLGLKRVFMIPQGCAAADGAYVRFPFEQALQVIARESLAARCVVIGEDLGTVPAGFRETLARWGLWTYRVMLFERHDDGRFRPPESYPAEAVATFNTHDLPSLAGWLAGHDLRVKRALGLDPGESDETRAWAVRCLREVLAEHSSPLIAAQAGIQSTTAGPEKIAPGSPLARGRAEGIGPEPETAGTDAATNSAHRRASGRGQTEDELLAVASFLARTPSRLVVIALDDILGEREQVNIPGTVDEHPNWRRKVAVVLEDLAGNENLRRVAEVFAKAGRAHG
jgi:4-alpha-glucanotransferase